MYPFNYDKQFEKYLSQFGRVFSGFQVPERYDHEINPDIGLRRVKVVYGGMSRIVATILNKRDSFSNKTLPFIAFNLSGIEQDQENRKNNHHVDHVVYKDANGIHRAYERLMGPAYTMNIEVSIYASSADEMFSIMEQIMLIFNPRVTIQVDNAIQNSDYITEIELESINNEINYPMGTDQRIVQQTMNFRVPVRLRYPQDNNASFIEEIRARILQESAEGLDEFVISEEIITGE